MKSAGPVLRDIHLPPAAWWPPAPGWWILAASVVVLTVVTVWWLWRRSRTDVAQLVQREITQLESAFARNQDTAALAAGASRLLRRVARRVEPAAAVAGGDAWREFLHRHAPDEQGAAVLEALATTSFQRQPRIDAVKLLDALRSWCTHALRSPAPASGVTARGSVRP
ncbi:MAG TPA: DUF4381 family protein [Rhodanobacteraceae bacterium]|nr:DUF4381 family protein [Rhodanobacteraceae bacterium]